MVKGAYDRRSEILYWDLLMALYKRVFGQMKMGVEKNLTTYRKKNQLEEWHACYRSTQKIKK